MNGHQGDGQRDPEEHQVDLRFPGNDVDQWDEQYEPHLEEHWNAGNRTDDGHDPVGTGRPQVIEQCLRQPLGATRLFEHFAEDPYKPDDGYQETKGSADT
ncbi:hypothetical protein D3C77_505220 [compost metagenome]